MGMTCSIKGRNAECMQGFGGNTKGERALGKPKYRRENIIKTDLRKSG
jgi:hypothetical protein